MSGKAEEITTAKEGAVIEICRGDAGAALVNFSDKEQKVKMATSLPDGEYADAVYGNKFKVAKGNLEGRVAPMTSYILYAN